MAKERSLWVSLKARTRKFERGIKRARRALRRFKSAIPGANLLLNKFTAALGIGAVGLFVKRAMTAIDATAKLADRIGTTTTELVGLQHAAMITGAGTEALNKGLEFMAKSLGEATQGIGEAKDALRLLRVDVRDLLGLNPAQQFRRIAEEVARLSTQEQRAFVATKLFGRAGIKLVNTLALGSKGLDKMQAEAKELGLTFTRIEAAQVEMANDAITRATAAWRGLSQRLAIGFAPYIESIATGFSKLGTKSRGVADVVVGAVEDIAVAIAEAVRVVRMTTSGLDLYISALFGRGNEPLRAAGRFAGAAGSVQDVRKRFRALREDAQRRAAEMQEKALGKMVENRLKSLGRRIEGTDLMVQRGPGGVMNVTRRNAAKEFLVGSGLQQTGQSIGHDMKRAVGVLERILRAVSDPEPARVR